MKMVCLALTAESAELNRLAADALRQEKRLAIALSTLRAGAMPVQTPDAAVFIGTSPRFWERCQPVILRLAAQCGQVICICAQAPDWLCSAERCEILPLPDPSDIHALARFRKSLLIRLKSIATRQDASPPHTLASRPSRRLVGIGASTGGPQVLLSILRELPGDTCGILVVQHLSTGFSSRFSEYLDPLCAMHVKQAENGEPVEDGTIYLAEDNRHLTVVRQADCYRLHSLPGEKINGFCPSADRLFESLAGQAGGSAMGIVLTGLGNDGAQGLLQLRQAGGYALAQNESCCAAPSMPHEAVRLGGAAEQLMPAELSARIRQFSRAGASAPPRSI